MPESFSFWVADDDRTVGDQGLGGSALLVDVEPGVRVHDLHLDIGVNALDAQEEGGVAGDDLGVVVGADVADLDLAVSGEAVGLGLGGQGAGLDQLLDLHACDDTGDIAALVDGGKLSRSEMAAKSPVMATKLMSGYFSASSSM